MGPTHPQVERLLARKQWAQRTPEWYERRKTLMTASDAAGALGIPAFEGQRGDIRASLIHQKVYTTFKGNMFTRHGSENEDMVRDRLAEIVGDEPLEFGLLVHPTLDWLGASPDGIFRRSGSMIEIKCPYKRRIEPGHVPHHYMPQIQTQMEVCSLVTCYFVQWQPAHLSHSGQEIFDIVLVQRDPIWFETHCDALHEFWKDLMDARAAFVPPPPPKTAIVDDLYDDEVYCTMTRSTEKMCTPK